MRPNGTNEVMLPCSEGSEEMMVRLSKTVTWMAACIALGCAAQVEDPIGERSDGLRTLEAVSDFGDNPAQLTMHVHSPTDLPAGPRPIVVALHGCTMNAAGYADAGWNDVADELGFHVIYPQQNTSRNNSLGCFNWGGSWPGTPNSFVASSTPLNTGDIERGGPEVTSIVSMVEHIVSTRGGDPNRVYVTGLSAGGGMAAVLIAAYPDVFAGGQILAGIPYGCATDRATTGEANACIQSYTALNAYLDRTPEEWAAIVAAAAPAGAPAPKVSIWHGTMDFVVNQGTSAELTEQWTAVHGATEGATETIEGATRQTFVAGGETVVERWTIEGMGHAAPIDPASGCGSTGSYINDVGVCSARLAATFFGLDGSGPTDPTDPTDPGAPVVVITSPTNGAFVDGGVTVRVDVDDDDGIDSLTLYVDDVETETIGSDPWRFDWDTTPMAEGAHRLRVVATDGSGATGSDEIQLVVDRPGGIDPPPVDMGPSDPMTGPDAGSSDPGGDGSGGASIAGCSASGAVGGLVWPLAMLLLVRRRER